MSKISTLPLAQPFSGAELVPVVQGGQTRQGTIAGHIEALIDPFIDEARQYSDAISGLAAPLAIYDSYAEAAAALPGLANGDVVEVLTDELRQSARTRYRVESAALVFKIELPKDFGPCATLAAIKLRRGRPGEALASSLYGGSVWLWKPQVKVQATVVNWDDQLHQQAAGGGVWECQTSSIIGWLRQQGIRNHARATAKRRLASSLATAMTVVLHADSIGYGQIPPQLVGGDMIPTGYGDGSMHQWTQVADPWLSYAHDFLESVVGAGKVETINRSLSGDRVENGYARGLFAPGTDYDAFGYGTNDNLFATNNGGADGNSQLGILEAVPAFGRTDEYIIDAFVDGYMKLIARSIIRGHAPILIAPGEHASLIGYDGTPWTASRTLMDFTNAVIGLGRLFDIPVVDFGEMVTSRSNADATFDGIHYALNGRKAAGAAFAGAVLGRGHYFRTNIAGPALIGSEIFRDAIDGLVSVGIAPVENTNSFGRASMTSTASADINISPGAAYHYSFYLDTDEIEVMPIGRMSAAGTPATVTCEADFGVPQAQRKINFLETALPGVNPTPPSSVSYTVAAGASRDFNHPGIVAEKLLFQGRGHHVLTIRVPVDSGGTFTLGGVIFGTFGDWQPIALLAGFAQIGDIQPAWRVHNGQLEIRGCIVAASPAVSDQNIWALPAGIAAGNANGIVLAQSVATETNNYGTAASKWTGTHLVWMGTGGTNILNLASVAPLPLLITAGN